MTPHLYENKVDVLDLILEHCNEKYTPMEWKPNMTELTDGTMVANQIDE